MFSKTCDKWWIYCSKVTEFWMENQEPIGGEGIVIEIDKILFGKRDKDQQANQT